MKWQSGAIRNQSGSPAEFYPPSVPSRGRGVWCYNFCDMPAGRPRTIKSPREMLRKGYAYFEKCRENEEPILVTGLVLALGLSCRDTLIEYGKRPEFADTVKALKTICEGYAETRLYGSNPTGAIFALKNFGWTDKTTVAGDPENPLVHEIRGGMKAAREALYGTPEKNDG